MSKSLLALIRLSIPAFVLLHFVAPRAHAQATSLFGQGGATSGVASTRRVEGGEEGLRRRVGELERRVEELETRLTQGGSPSWSPGDVMALDEATMAEMRSHRRELDSLLVSEAAVVLGSRVGQPPDMVVLARCSRTAVLRGDRVLVRMFVTMAARELLGISVGSVGVLRPGVGKSFQVTVAYSLDRRPVGIVEMQWVDPS